MAIKDSGEKRTFETGSHRDMNVGKGRMDLLPAESVIEVYGVLTETEQGCDNTSHTRYLEESLVNIMYYFTGSNKKNHLAVAARAALIATGIFETLGSDSEETAVKGIPGYLAYGLKQVSMHYEAGAIKYGENNWKLGQPMSVLLDSGARHLTKAIGEIVDEPHCRAAGWNLLSAIWTEKNLPNMQNIETRKNV